MNILLVTDNLLPDVPGGSGRVVAEWSKGLAKKGHSIYILTRQANKDLPLKEDLGGIKVCRYKTNSRNDLTFFSSSIRNTSLVFNKIGIPFDLINFHQSLSAIGVITSNRVKKIPKIYTFYSPWHKEYETRPKNKLNRLLVRVNSLIRFLIERFCIRKCEKIVVLSEFSRRQLMDYHHISDSRINIIPGGVDIERFKPATDKGEIRKKIGIPEDRFILFTVRNLVPRMGLENLIKAVSMLEDRDVTLVIGGKGPLERKLRKLTRELGLEERVYFTGFIDEKKLPLYYQVADLFVLPSLYLEGFGLVTLEALSSGLPVLGTPVGGTKEILGRFDSSLLFRDVSPESMADLISRYIRYPGLNELSKRCREFVVRNYSWDNAVTELDKLTKMD